MGRGHGGGVLRIAVLGLALCRVAAAEPASDATEDGEVIEITDKVPTQTEPVSYRLTRDELALVAGTDDDVLRAAQALPGVARIPYSFGGLVLRGTSPADTAVYLDGVPVPLAFHFGGLASFYPSDMIAELAVTPGGFDASYGRAEGGIVTMTTREPRTDRWRIGGSIDLLSASAMAEGPIAGGGLIVGVRRSYVDAVVWPFVPNDTPLPSYWDAQARASFGDPARGGRITPMVFLSIDHLADRASGAPGEPEHLSIVSQFVRVAVPYLRQWGPLALQIVPWLGANKLSYLDVSNGSPATYSRPTYPAGLRATVTRDFAWGHLRGGIDSEGGHLSQGQLDLPPPSSPLNGHTTMTWLDGAAWAEARAVLFHDRLAVKPGLRVDRYGLTRENVVDPRINIDVTAAPAVIVHGALGRFHQPPIPADLDPIGGNPELKSSYYDQASLGVEAALPAGFAASLTGFYDRGHDLGLYIQPPIDLDWLGPALELLLTAQLGVPAMRNNLGSARSDGVELMVKRHVGRWFGMLSYTLSKSQVTYPFSPSSWHRFDLDQRHNLNVAGSVSLEPWTLGARVQIVTGGPYDPETCTQDSSGDVQCVNGAPYSGTLPTFFQLDLRADRVWHRHSGDLHGYIDIQNATDRANVESRVCRDACVAGVAPERDVPGLPILPFIGVKWIPN